MAEEITIRFEGGDPPDGPPPAASKATRGADGKPEPMGREGSLVEVARNVANVVGGEIGASIRDVLARAGSMMTLARSIAALGAPQGSALQTVQQAVEKHAVANQMADTARQAVAEQFAPAPEAGHAIPSAMKGTAAATSGIIPTGATKAAASGAASAATGATATTTGAAATGAAAGGASLASIAAVAAPIAVAVAAVGAFALAVKMSADAITNETEKLRNVSPDVGLAKDLAEVSREMSLMRRGQEIGPQLAAWTNQQAKFDQAMADIWTQVLKILLQMWDGTKPFFEVAHDVLMELNAKAAKANELLAIVKGDGIAEARADAITAREKADAAWANPSDIGDDDEMRLDADRMFREMLGGLRGR